MLNKLQFDFHYLDVVVGCHSWLFFSETRFKLVHCFQAASSVAVNYCPNDLWFVATLDVSKNRGTEKWMVYNGKPCSNG